MKNFAKMIVMTAALSGTVFASPAAQGDPDNGAKVWADNCVRCHNLRPPSELSARAWKITMQHMRVRANLTGKEARDTLAFILTSK
jgi:mono/diheme cytochrome c family protein